MPTAAQLAKETFDRLSNQQIFGATALTYAATMTPDCSLGLIFTITVTDTVAMTINAPLNPAPGQFLTFDFLNSSGGVQGALTLNAAFKPAGAFVVPANTKRRTITFQYNGTNWIEVGRAAADI